MVVVVVVVVVAVVVVALVVIVVVVVVFLQARGVSTSLSVRQDHALPSPPSISSLSMCNVHPSYP